MQIQREEEALTWMFAVGSSSLVMSEDRASVLMLYSVSVMFSSDVSVSPR